MTQFLCPNCNAIYNTEVKFDSNKEEDWKKARVQELKDHYGIMFSMKGDIGYLGSQATYDFSRNTIRDNNFGIYLEQFIKKRYTVCTICKNMNYFI